jgi:uncharacterized membrane protein
MLFLIVLSVATVFASAVLAARRAFATRTAARTGMAIAMMVAGVAHLVMPTPFEQHLPTWVPARELLVAGTGVLEVILGAALLLGPPLRRRAGLALAVYLTLVFPANVYVAVSGTAVDGQPSGVYPWLRLPFQLLFIAWALWCTRQSPERPANLGGAPPVESQLR